MLWDSEAARVRLSKDNAKKLRRKLYRASVSLTLSRRGCKSLLGSLNFAADVTLLCRLCHRRLVRMVNIAIPIRSNDLIGMCSDHKNLAKIRLTLKVSPLGNPFLYCQSHLGRFFNWVGIYVL